MDRWQPSLFDESRSVPTADTDADPSNPPATELARYQGAETRRALDELFEEARRYHTTKEYRELLEFVIQFRFYSPYNAMLVHIQMPGAQFVAPAFR